MAATAPRNTGKNPADFTGIQSQRLAEEHAVEQKEQAEHLAMVTAAAVEDSDVIIDYTGSDTPLPEVEKSPVEINTPYRTIRVNSEIKEMTFGRQVLDVGDPETGRPAVMGSLVTLNFVPGKPYKVRKELADHLNAQGRLAYLGQ